MRSPTLSQKRSGNLQGSNDWSFFRLRCPVHHLFWERIQFHFFTIIAS